MDQVEKELFEQIKNEGYAFEEAAFEMAFSRSDIIEVCLNLGTRFAEHFDKIYKQGKSCFTHHCIEMTAWLNKINKLVMKTTNKKLTKTQKYDWFFTAGSIPEYLFSDPNEVNAYKVFIGKLQANPELPIAEALKEYNK